MAKHLGVPKVGIRIPPCQSATDIVDLVCRAEDLGFDAVGIPDSPMLWRDTFAVLTLAATRTERVILRSLVTNPVTRHPMSLASSIRTVAELAAGRFALGLGAGDSAVILSGRRPARHAEMREALRMIRDLLDGKSARGDMPNALLHDPCPAPLFLAADGPRNLALAAEMADGVITSFRQLPEKRATIAAAAERVGRREFPYHVVTVETRVTDDFERDACAKKRTVVKYLQREGTRAAEEAGFDIEVPERAALGDGADLGHSRDLALAEEFASRYISDDMAIWYWTNFAMCGTVEEIVVRIRELVAIGVDEISLKHGSAFTVPHELIEQFGSEILPRLR